MVGCRGWERHIFQPHLKNCFSLEPSCGYMRISTVTTPTGSRNKVTSSVRDMFSLQNASTGINLRIEASASPLDSVLISHLLVFDSNLFGSLQVVSATKTRDRDRLTEKWRISVAEHGRASGIRLCSAFSQPRKNAAWSLR